MICKCDRIAWTGRYIAHCTLFCHICPPLKVAISQNPLVFIRVSRFPEGKRENALFSNVSGRVPAGHAGTVCFTMVSPMLREERNVFVLQWFPASRSGSVAFSNVYRPWVSCRWDLTE